MTYFDKNLKLLMKKTGKNQDDIAQIVNVNRTSVSNWVNRRSSPDLNKIDEIANIFNIEASDLVYKDLTTAPDMTINIRANRGSNPNVQILDSVSESRVGYTITGTDNHEVVLKKENGELKSRVSYLEGQVNLLRELLGK